MQLLTRGNWFQKEAGLHFIHPHKIISFRIFFLLLRDMGGGGNPRALLYRATINPIRSGYQMNPTPLELRGFATSMLIFPTLTYMPYLGNNTKPKFHGDSFYRSGDIAEFLHLNQPLKGERNRTAFF